MIKEIFEYILSVLKSRIAPLVLVFAILLSVLISRLFSLQIINGESYRKNLNDAIVKTMSVPAARGKIFDKNGVLLAYNDLAFAVKISDSGTYKNNTVKNETVNGVIHKTLKILDEKGDTYSNDFKVKYTEGQGYSYTVSGTSLLRFLRDSYGTPTMDTLTEEQRNSSAEELIDYECKRYGIKKEDYSPEHLIELIYLRLQMSANSYNRYMTFTISNEVSPETVAAILENSEILVGVTIEEQYIRRYVNSVYCSQIIGYTGSISSEELESMNSEDEIYEYNDTIGKSGIEKSLERELSGTKGSKTVYVDTVGRITEVIEETDAVAGNDVYLTIDIDLQKKIYEAIENKLIDILLSNMTSSNEKYTYKRDGSIDDIYVTIKEMYFALIDNNIVSIDLIEAGAHSNEANIYSSFVSKKDSFSNWLKNDLTINSTPYNKLSDEYQEYVWYIYTDILRANNIFDSGKVDSSDEVYRNWNAGDTTSLEQFLKYAISKNWIDMSKLATQQYTSLQESYDILVSYIFSEIEADADFHKLLYKYMIENGNISGRQVCMLLYEQGIIEDDGTYDKLNRGSLSAYDFMRNALANKIITPAQLALSPCSGSCVITDPNNGNIIALVSYPSYDNNRLSGMVDSEYYAKLNADKSIPLYNWATQSQHAPGSTFKICSAIAGLETGVISTSSTYSCFGSFNEVTPAPYCWLRSGHGSESVSGAIRDSCNVFFYNVGYQLAKSKTGSYVSDYGTDILKNYAEQMGLATMSGIEIEERSPNASDTDAIQSAIGQGNNSFSTLNLSRYCSTIANKGTCYNVTLIDKVTNSQGELIRDNSATVSNKMTVSDSTWNAVHNGMKMAGQSYSAFSSLGFSVSAKTGTAQESRFEPDHALVISYAPSDNPDISIAVAIPNGYSSSNAAALTGDIYKIYYNIE